jgi:methylated-DNA-[protein]-cysteine S-methyltransferase
MEKTYLQYGKIVLEIAGDENGISSINFVKHKLHDEIPECLAEAHKQLKEYFSGTREKFDLKLNISGTDFQKKVWKALQEIPYGETRTYRDIAVAVGTPKRAGQSAEQIIKIKSPLLFHATGLLARTAVWSVSAAAWQ